MVIRKDKVMIFNLLSIFMHYPWWIELCSLLLVGGDGYHVEYVELVEVCVSWSVHYGYKKK